MTQEEIVLETIEHYRTHPRSVDREAETCLYISPNGERCAYSRCCTPESRFHEGVGCYEQPDAALKPEYKMHSTRFWMALQRLHDKDMNWTPNDCGGQDLSEEGRVYVKLTFKMKVKPCPRIENASPV